MDVVPYVQILHVWYSNSLVCELKTTLSSVDLDILCTEWDKGDFQNMSTFLRCIVNNSNKDILGCG